MKVRTIIIGLLISLNLSAQDLPDLTNYEHNWLIFNPAFTGSGGALSVNAFSRDKAGFGATGRATPVPKYFQLSMHSPFANWENASYGFSYFNMKQPGTGIIGLIGGTTASVPMSEHNLSGYYSYKVNFGDGFILAMGLSGMLSYTSVDYNSLDLRQGIDPQFDLDIQQELKYNFGTGIMLQFNDNFIAASVPRLLFHDSDTAGFAGGGSVPQPVSQYRNYNYMLTGGSEITMGRITLKPSFLAGYIPTSGIKSLNYMASMNFGFLDEQIWLGGIYKSSRELSLNMNIKPQDWLLIGFCWDFSLQPVAGYFDNAFEIILRIENRQRKPLDVPFYF